MRDCFEREGKGARAEAVDRDHDDRHCEGDEAENRVQPPTFSDRVRGGKLSFVSRNRSTELRRKRSHDHASWSGSIRPKSERVSPSKGPESGRLKLPQPVKVGHPDRADKAMPAG